MSRIYLDHAATSWPKPETVYRAVDRAQRDWGVAGGRGASREAGEIARMMDTTRSQIAALLNLDAAERIVFAQNGTAALNMAIHGVLRPGDHAICSMVDHNSVLRPLDFLQRSRDLQTTIVPCDLTGYVDPDDIRRAIRPNTKLIALTHASNVTGRIQDIEAVGRIAGEHDILFLLDAAQTLGTHPLDVRATEVDLLAAPGHKGLLGPLGTGILAVGHRAAERIVPIVQGGTGTASESPTQPETWPDRMESGNPNYPAIAGLHAGVTWVREQGIDAIAGKMRKLTAHFLDGWKSSGLDRFARIIGSANAADRTGVVSLASESYDPQELAIILDQFEPRIQTRSGLHCSPLAHRALGTFEKGGTLRLSWGAATKMAELDQTLAALTEILAT